jgi:release factor glutamine methyltransferase
MFPLLVKKVIRNNILARSAENPNNSRSLYTVKHAFDKWKSQFEKENVPEPENSIENLLAHVLKTKSIHDVRKIKNQPLTDTQSTKLENLCTARLARMPVQYIIGFWEFRDIKLRMVPPVFIPRPETEELVELILQQMDHDKEIKFLEIGSGSGAISLSLLKELPKVNSLKVPFVSDG